MAMALPSVASPRERFAEMPYTRDANGNWIAVKQLADGTWVPKDYRTYDAPTQDLIDKGLIIPKPGMRIRTRVIGSTSGTGTKKNTTTNTGSGSGTNTSSGTGTGSSGNYSYTPPKMVEDYGPVRDWETTVNANFGKQTMKAGGAVKRSKKMAAGGIAGAPATKTNRGLGSQVSAMAKADRTGGIGKQVSAMAKRPAVQTMKAGGLVARGAGCAVRGNKHSKKMG